MSFYHANPETLTEEQRRTLDKEWRIRCEIENMLDKASNWKTVKSRLAEVVLHSDSVVSDVAAREKVATIVKSVPEFPAAEGAAAPPGAALAAPAAVEPGSSAAAAAPELGLVAEQTPSDEKRKKIFVAFVFDFTASMQRYINAAAKAAIDVLRRLQEGNLDTTMYAALVGYTDIDPFKPVPPQHEASNYTIVDFTTDMTIVHRALNNAQANGGDDIAENMAGAFDKVGNLSWPTETGPHITKKVVIVTDAPPHGKKYHTPDVYMTDNFPRGCPFGFDPNSQIEKFARENIDVIVFCLEPRILDRMIEEFQAAHQRGLIPGCTADFIVMDAIQQSAAPPPSWFYRGSLFADEDDEDADRCSIGLHVPEFEDYGNERSFGCDDDDDSVSRSFVRSFPRSLGVNRGGDSDDEAPPFMPMATPMPAAAGHTMEDVFRKAFSTRKL